MIKLREDARGSRVASILTEIFERKRILLSVKTINMPRKSNPCVRKGAFHSPLTLTADETATPTAPYHERKLRRIVPNCRLLFAFFKF